MLVMYLDLDWLEASHKDDTTAVLNSGGRSYNQGQQQETAFRFVSRKNLVP